MKRTLSLGSEELRLGPGLAPIGEHGFMELDDPGRAPDLLGRFLDDPHALAVLREMVSLDPALPDPSSLDDMELIEALSGSLADGRLRAERLRAPALGTHGGEPEEAAPPPRVAPVAETTWVEFKVIDDRTNRPIAGVKLTITLPDGVKADHTTSEEGLVTIDPVRPGSCAVRTEVDDLRFDSALEYVGIGDGPIDEEGPILGREVRRVALVERHKVRTGESLDSLAKANGMTWRGLARFNFGTDDPKKINGHLRHTVGCTRRTHDRKNYVFDDRDEPGIVLIPRALERAGMDTGRCHVLRVRPLLRPTKPFIFSY